MIRSNICIWTFPISFISAPQICFEVFSELIGCRWIGTRIHNIYKNNIQLQLLGLEDFIESANGYTNLNYISAIVIGRWK